MNYTSLDVLITFPKLLEILLQNDPAHTTLTLRTGQLDNLSEANKKAFCSALKSNTTLIHLNLSSNIIDERFMTDIATALMENNSLMDLFYDDRELSSQALIKDINAVLLRNKVMAFEKIIQPQEIENPIHGYDDKACAFLAIESGNLNLLYTLIKKNSSLLREVNIYGMSLLDVATECGQLDCIKLLIQHGMDINLARKGNGGNALSVAVSRNRLSIAYFLLIQNIDVNQSSNGHSPFHCVKSKEMAELLLEFKADINVLSTSTKSRAKNSTVLHSAVWEPYPDIKLLKFLLQRLDVNTQNEVGETALHIVCSWGSYPGFLEVFNLFLAAGANPLIRDQEGDTVFDVLGDQKGDEKLSQKIYKEYLSIKPGAKTTILGYHPEFFGGSLQMSSEICLKRDDADAESSDSADKIVKSNFGN